MDRRLAAVLAADVAGYSRLMGVDEEGTLARLKAVRKALIDPTIAAHRGRIVKTTGDGLLVEFSSAVDAVRGAAEVQSGMAEQNASMPQDQRIKFRIGIHVGDIIIDENDIFGDGVNVAARVENECEPGGVLLSGNAFEQIRGKTNFAFDDLGEKTLKNIERPVRLYAVRNATSAATTTTAAISILPSDHSKPLPLPDKPSIAVLPFQNMSGDPDQEYFADGMVEEIITALSRNKQLFVIARNSSFTFKGKAVDIKQVARDLGVRYVLEGSVRKSGNRIRITGQLIDASSGAHLWADKYDGALEDVFELQDQVASSVAGAIVPNVTQAEMERAKRKSTSSLDAYDYYLRAEAAHFQYSRDGTDQAIALFEHAIALDPQFALAHAAQAATINTRQTWGWSADPAADAAQSLAHARSALRLGRQDAQVLARSALPLISQSREVELADRLLDEAIQLDPNGMSGWMWGGFTRIILGDYQTGIDYERRALRLSPLDPRIFFAQAGLAYGYFFLEDYEKGVQCASDALRHHPSNLVALRIAMACNALSGNVEVAQQLQQQLILLAPSEGVSGTPARSPYKGKALLKLMEAYRLAGMPE